jgi:L-threonylcarbamoyladenylate synthase
MKRSGTEPANIVTVEQAVAALNHSDVIAYPTEAVFGLGCDPDDEQAIRHLLELKDRSQAKGLIIIASDISQLAGYINENLISDDMWARAKDTWPGPVTWLMPANASVSPLLTGEHDTIAVRVTAHPIASRLCRQFAKPVVSTSANIAGQPPARSAEEVQQQFRDRIKCIVAGEVDASISPTEIRDLLTNTVIRKSS